MPSRPGSIAPCGKIHDMTQLEAIYENGIFKPVSDVPETLKEHERVRITIETDTDEDLLTEFEQWEAASERDFLKLERSLGEDR
jgi:predicted DNA-binding antitoxin AbrB/MazE fold protein